MNFRRLTLLACMLGCCGMALGQTGAAPALNYKAATPWPLPSTSAIGKPGPWNLIQASSVAVNSNGNVLVLHRGAHPILEFDSNGKFIRSDRENQRIQVFDADGKFLEGMGGRRRDFSLVHDQGSAALGGQRFIRSRRPLDW